MKKINKFLMPIIGISTIGAITIPLVSGCSCKNPTSEITVTFTTDGNGTVSQPSKKVKKTLAFSDIVADVTVTPAQGYEFDKWVDKDGNEIASSATFNSDFTAKALFVEEEKTEYTLEWLEDESLYTNLVEGTWAQITLRQNVEYTFTINLINDKCLAFCLSDGSALVENWASKCSVTLDGVENTDVKIQSTAIDINWTVKPTTGKLVVKFTYVGEDGLKCYPFLSGGF